MQEIIGSLVMLTNKCHLKLKFFINQITFVRRQEEKTMFPPNILTNLSKSLCIFVF